MNNELNFLINCVFYCRQITFKTHLYKDFVLSFVLTMNMFDKIIEKEIFQFVELNSYIFLFHSATINS